MPIVTKPTHFQKGVAATYTLDKAALAAHIAVAADAYYSVPANWREIHVAMGSTTGNQRIYMTFDATQSVPPGAFYASSTALDDFEVLNLIIRDNDNGTFPLSRADLVTAEFDIAKNDAPLASGVSVLGTPQDGQTLNANYTYSDADGDTEGVTTYQWYVADDGAGLNRTMLAGATASTYLVTATEVGKFINCEITPVANSGVLVGVAAVTPYTTVVVA